MADINARIEARIRSFAEELQGLIGSAIREHVENALGSFHSVGASAGPKRSAAPKEAAAAPAPKGKVRRASRRKGAKRTAAEIQKTTAALQAYIGSKPGQRMEQIGVALSTATKDLTRPLAKLIESGVVRREGVKRASRYFATGKAAAAPAAPKGHGGRKPTGRKPGRPRKS